MEQKDQAVNESTETRLMSEWREIADPVRAQRNDAQAALAAAHLQQEKTLLESMDKHRSDHAAELTKNHPDMEQEHKNSLIALDAAKRIEQLQKQQAAERKTLSSGLPEVPSYVTFLEERAATDAEAAKLLEIERSRNAQEMSIKGQRIADLDPMVLEGLTHEAETGDGGQAIHYARDGERVMTDRGERLDVYRMDNREIEAALRLASQKYDMEKGLVLTGSREFQERAAEVAERLNLKIQNPELQASWQKGFANNAGTGMLPAGGIEQARDLVTEVQSIDYPVDHQYLGAEYVLARLDAAGREALQAARDGKVLSDQQRDVLSGEGRHPALVDANGCLNEAGANVYERMNAGLEEDRQLQQQLRTRNIDETLELKEEQVESHAEHADHAQEQKVVTRKSEVRKRDQSQEMGV